MLPEEIWEWVVEENGENIWSLFIVYRYEVLKTKEKME